MKQPFNTPVSSISIRRFSMIGINLCLAAGLLWSLKGRLDAQAPAATPGTGNFTGGAPTKVEENSEAAIAHFNFPPGVRTKWHSHSGGQIILVESGVGRVQTKGGPVRELKAGESIYAMPGEVHWHGSAPTAGGVQFNVTRGQITWMNEVSDAEYKAAPKKK